MTERIVTRETLLKTAYSMAMDWMRAETKEDCEYSLHEFIKTAWPYLDSSEFKDCWALQALCEHLEAVTYGEIRRLLINLPPRVMKTTSSSVCWPAWTWIQSRRLFTSGPQVRFLCGSYNASLALQAANKERRLILSPWFQANWGDRFTLTEDQAAKAHFDNTQGGSRISTSVGGTLLGIGGDIIDVDDPHNTETEKLVETDADRKRVASWWQELHSTRLNDPKLSAVVVTMQRLHQGDLSGVILDSDEDFVHLMIPMEFDERRRCVTVQLPKMRDRKENYEWEDPREQEGELMWPERFGHAEVRNLKTALGPYMCTPREAPVLMSDLSLKPIGEVRVGDELVGFETATGREHNPLADYKRRKLRCSHVVGKVSLKAKVVRIVFKSGEVIRCTPEHRWYVGKSGGRRGYFPNGEADIRPLYRPALVGRKLLRACPPALPELTSEEQRMAGWLAGFFDGEGSASAQRGCERGRVATQIRFHQGTGRNKPLCDLLEKYLTYFGFSFKYSEHVRSDRRVHKAVYHKSRVYELLRPDGALPLLQKFMHVVKPTKWRERIIEAAFGANWIVGTEEVVSIVDDGEEEVFALETETGNYIVWGLASANSSGRLQQSPSPKGGGIIKREWWQPWDEVEAKRYGLEWSGARKEFPKMSIVVGSLDTALKEKEENDFNALTIWGVWVDGNKNQRAMLMYAWAKRLPLHGKLVSADPGETKVQFESRQKEEWGLVEWIADTCRRYKVQRLLIEDKTRGHDVAAEIKRLYARENWGIWMVNPVQDKVARAHTTVPLFTDDAIWAPDTKWADAVITEAELFPKGVHDDYVDSVTQFINWARENDLLIRADEMSAAIADEAAFKPQQKSVAEQYGV